MIIKIQELCKQPKKKRDIQDSDTIPVNLRCPMNGSRIKVAGRFQSNHNYDAALWRRCN